MIWATHVLQWRPTEEANPRGPANPKTASQFGLEAATRPTKLESLVIADQNAAVNTFPGLVHTARHTMGVCNTRSQWPNRKGSCRRWGR